MRKKVSV